MKYRMTIPLLAAGLFFTAGAWAIPPEDKAAHREGSGAASAIGWETLERGGSAVLAVLRPSSS